MTISPDQIKALLEIGSIIGTICAGFVALIWRLSRYFHQNDARLGALASVLKTVGEKVLDLDRSIAGLQATIYAHEKDVAKLEGICDATRRDLMATVKELAHAVSKIDAMWLTLQRLFPDKVPARVADRK